MLADAVEYINFPPSCQSNPTYYLTIQDLIPKAIAHHFNRVFSDPYDAYRGAENIFKNLPRVFQMPSFDKAKGFLKGKPALLVASGPSLTESLPILQKIQDQVLMIACPSALSLLIKNNIKPHLWLNIERDENVGDLFRDLSEKPKHIFIAPPLVHPKCFETNGGYNTFLLSQGLFAQWLPFASQPIDFGHSAANAAFRILEILECNEIYLVGQDLSYTKNQESHVSGAWEETKRFSENLQKENRQTLQVEGNDGQPILTNLYWYTYLKNFTEQLIPFFKGKIFNVIPQNFGAKISGVTRIDPTDLLEKFKNQKEDFVEVLKENLLPPTDTEQRDIHELFSQK
ncbi:MAG: DUF115 domain-containing protein [Deltaproteobacteria bacterium]|nr:MAG: DUF115 domain-containing protein [Deltaproteobacteria bacterium]